MTESSPPSEVSQPEVRSAPLPPPVAPVSDDPASPHGPAPREQPGYPDLSPQPAYPGHPPRAGELTAGWRITTAVAWISVVLAMATVWNVSRQLGLSTWWLGTRAQPQPRIVQLSPFLCPMLMLLGAISHVRWLGWFGLISAGVIAGYGVVDLGHVSSIASVELLIAGLAAAVSIASLTGTYRRDPSSVAAQHT